ncbi:MAG: AAA family ATPase, partial [Prochlorococcaceae cyanobacterium]
MQLISARLERVRQHRLLELRFARGFSLIAGANETGKSTVVDALHKALFLKATATGRGIEELRSLTHGGLPEVELRFAAAGSTWLLRKRFAGSGGTCQLSPENGPTLLGQTAETKLAELLQVSGPIEGRRIAQLPLRWAHLWVRQGEAGDDPLAGGGEAYDLAQLVQQLQQRGGQAAAGATAAALESPLDRQVQQQLQQQLDLQLTSTGKVRAGSPLAASQQRESEARSALSQAELRLAEL